MNDHFCMATQIFKESLEGIYLGGRMATICGQVAIQFFCSLSLRVRLPFRTWKGSTHGRKVVENRTLVPVLRMATSIGEEHCHLLASEDPFGNTDT